jgi:SAM-dependent methyltransferase
MIPQSYTDSCPVCKNSRWHNDRLAERMLGLVEPYRIQFCGGCGQGRLVPQLSTAELRSLYDGSYFNNAHDLSRTGANLKAPEVDYASQVVPERLAKFSRTLRDLRRLAPQACTLLDVGAATGEMVRLARDAGLVADGLEFSEYASRRARELYGIELMNVPLADLQASADYDLIHLNHVFEHFNDPLAELARLRRLLKPGGLLYIEVPLQFHVVTRMRMRIRPVDPGLSVHSLHHPFFYNADTLRRLLSANGFEVLRTRVFDASRYPAATAIQRAKRMLWQLLAAFEIGNFVEIIARPVEAAR